MSTLACGMVLAFLLAPTLTAETIHTTTPFSVTTVNLCNGEVVALTGTVDMSMSTEADGSGGFHQTMQSVTKGDGISPASGTRYKFSQESSLIYEQPGPSDVVIEHDVLNQIFNGTGPTDNWLFKIRAKIMIDGRGVPKPPVLEFSSECRG